MLGDRGLGDTELGLDGGAQRSGVLFTLGQQLQDPPPDRLAQHIEGVHARTISCATYISITCYSPHETNVVWLNLYGDATAGHTKYA